MQSKLSLLNIIILVLAYYPSGTVTLPFPVPQKLSTAAKATTLEMSPLTGAASVAKTEAIYKAQLNEKIPLQQSADPQAGQSLYQKFKNNVAETARNRYYTRPGSDGVVKKDVAAIGFDALAAVSGVTAISAGLYTIFKSKPANKNVTVVVNVNDPNMANGASSQLNSASLGSNEAPVSTSTSNQYSLNQFPAAQKAAQQELSQLGVSSEAFQSAITPQAPNNNLLTPYSANPVSTGPYNANSLFAGAPNNGIIAS